MKITVTFDTLEEFQTYMGIQSPSKPAQEAAQGAQEAPKGAGAKKDTKKDTKKAAKAQEAAQAPAEDDLMEDTPAPGTPTAPEVTEDFRVEVRKTLAQLNKKVGKNIASELIKGFGVDKLTEVALADLPALMSKAKEALNAE